MAEFRKALLRNIKKFGLSGIGVLCALLLFRFFWWLLDQALGDVFVNYVNSHGPEWLKYFAANPLGSLIGAGVLFVSFCAVVATRDEWIRKYVEFIREPDIPALDILWKQGEEVYHYPYTLPPDPAVNLHYRICVVNISKRTQVKDIEVRLESIKPRELPMVPCHLRLMNNILPHEPVIKKFTLTRDGSQFIDVMAQAPDGNEFWFWHTVLPMIKPIPAQGYTFVISAKSPTTPMVQRTFVLEKDGVYWKMRMI